MSYWIVQLLNAVQASMLLFLVAVGLGVVFGLMNVVNLAHGAFYAFGAYLGWTVLQATGSFPLAFLLAPALTGLPGLAVYALAVARMQRAGHLAQVIATLGLLFVSVEALRALWGDIPLEFPVPPALAGSVDILGTPYPVYRLSVVALGLAVAALLWLVLSRTIAGAMVRAAVDNVEMAAALGVRTGLLFPVVFVLGCALAGLGGVVAAPLLSVHPGMGVEVLVPALVVVVVGGLGSLQGTLVGALLVGLADTFGAVMGPQLSGAAVYALLAAVLVLRPGGLLPARS
ncbi:High-affinity branched-chain amino acid transport system permease protein LivH [bacterium HR39]|nr:High-affinity branched-chain amino acid transport system permease protein LivH [bacterium HR39]